MFYVIKPNEDKILYVTAYTSDIYLLTKYQKEMESIKTPVTITTFEGSEDDLLKQENLQILDKLKLFPSEDGTVGIVMSEHLKQQVQHCLPEHFVLGYISNLVSAVIWVVTVIHAEKSISDYFDDVALMGIASILYHVVSIYNDGVHSTEIDHIKLVSQLWGWGDV